MGDPYSSSDKSPPEQAAESCSSAVGKNVENIRGAIGNKRLMELIGNSIENAKNDRKADSLKRKFSAPVRLESKENGPRKQAVDSTMGNLVYTGERRQIQLIARSVG